MYRAATLADADALGALLHRGDPIESAEDNAAYVRNALAQEGAWIELTERDGGPIAVAGFEPSIGREEDVAGEGVAYVRMLFVDPSWWGTGVAVEAMGRAVAAMQSAGNARAYLWTGMANGRARRFYEREGWHWDGAQRFHEVWKEQCRYVRDLD